MKWFEVHVRRKRLVSRGVRRYRRLTATCLAAGLVVGIFLVFPFGNAEARFGFAAQVGGLSGSLAGSSSSRPPIPPAGLTRLKPHRKMPMAPPVVLARRLGRAPRLGPWRSQLQAAPVLPDTFRDL